MVYKSRDFDKNLSKGLKKMYRFVILGLTQSKEFSLMDALKKEFWKHAASVGGPADLEDIFLSWAAKQKLSFEAAAPLWSSINKDVYATFGKKVAGNVSVSGDAAEIRDLFSDGGAPAGVLEEAKEDIINPSSDVETTPEKPKVNTLMDSFGEPDEENISTPPTEGILPTALSGGTPPAPPTGAPPPLPT